MRKSPLALILSLTVIFLISLPDITSGDTEEEFLPIELTPEEMERLDEIGKTHRSTYPPSGIIRNPAEWEPSTGVIIRWPLGISISLVAELSEDVVVHTIVGSSSQQSSAISAYTSGGVNMDNTEFIIAPTNSIWTRDYGPWFIFQNERLAIVDHIYNRPRPYDDVIPQVIGTEWGLHVYGMDLITTGGNHMSDGLGMSMSTKLVYNENPSLSWAEVDSTMYLYLGNDYTVLDYIESSGIHHIDCWAKFLNPTTIMIKDVPIGSSSYALLNARADYLAQQISAWGQPYTIVRVYCPYGTAYTNSLILNDKVFVPTFGSAYDDDALQTYAAAMPGYEILGFDGSWYDNDAIHCRTMGVPDADMLFIDHDPLVGVYGPNNNCPISATISDYSDMGLISDSLKIYYSVDGNYWEFAPLSSTPLPDSFYGEIPAQLSGSDVSYYIQAADNSGRVETHPYIGAPWAHSFSINMSPTIISADSFMCQGGDAFSYRPEFEDADDTTHTTTYTNFPVWLSVHNDSLVGSAPIARELSTFDVEVSDPFSTDSQEVTLFVYLCGDVDDDGEGPIVTDLSYLVDYLFRDGTAPPVTEAANVDGVTGPGGPIDVADLTYLVDYLFRGGPDPACN